MADGIRIVTLMVRIFTGIVRIDTRIVMIVLRMVINMVWRGIIMARISYKFRHLECSECNVEKTLNIFQSRYNLDTRVHIDESGTCLPD